MYIELLKTPAIALIIMGLLLILIAMNCVFVKKYDWLDKSRDWLLFSIACFSGIIYLIGGIILIIAITNQWF